MQRNRFTNEHKMEVVKKSFETKKNLKEFSKEIGVSYQNLLSWRNGFSKENKIKTNPDLALVKLLLESMTALDEQKIGEILRSKGFKTADLSEAKKIIENKFYEEDPVEKENKELKKKIQSAENELKKKDQVIVGMAAEYTLLKKSREIFSPNQE